MGCRRTPRHHVRRPPVLRDAAQFRHLRVERQWLDEDRLAGTGSSGRRRNGHRHPPESRGALRWLEQGRESVVDAGADTWEWDGSRWTRMDAPGLPTAGPRTLPAMAFDAARSVTVLFGGAYNGPFMIPMRDDTFEWNGREWRQRTTTGAPFSPRHRDGVPADAAENSAVRRE